MMKSTRLLVASILFAITGWCAQPPGFLSHQGFVRSDGIPLHGTGSFKFALVDGAGTTTYWSNDGTSTGGGEPTTAVDLTVTRGIYSVALGDTNIANITQSVPAGVFGQQADVRLRVWFDDGIRGSQLLVPDQRIASVGYALSAALAQGVVDGAISSANLVDGAALGEILDDDGAGSGLDADLLDGRQADELWQLGGNAGTTPGAHFLGTTDNTSLELRVNGLRALRIEPRESGLWGFAPNVIGGTPANSVGANNSGATIAGGGAPAFSNEVTGDFGVIGGGFGNVAGYFSTVAGGAENAADSVSTVGGGDNNTATAYGAVGGGARNEATSEGFSTVAGGFGNTADRYASTVAGGQNNTATGNYAAVGGGDGNTASGVSSTVGGGDENTASGDYSTVAGGRSNSAIGIDATVSGGFTNTAVGPYSTVVGGYENTATGSLATVCGGYANTAAGDRSLAAGSKAKANHSGTFVWADNSDAEEFASTGINQFLIRAVFGVGINTSLPNFDLHVNGTAGKPGGGSWTTASDARLKDVGEPFKRGLEAIEQLQPKHYRYLPNNALDLPIDREYVGLIAQEVEAAVPEAVERNDSGYLHVNNDPILWTMLNALGELKAENDAKTAEVNDLKARLAALEALVEPGATFLHSGEPR